MSDPTDTLRARVEQAQDLAAAATPGPWIVQPDGRGRVQLDHVETGEGSPAGQGVPVTSIPRKRAADAEFIAAAPDLVALITDLWAAYMAACDRADGRDRLEADVRRLTVERDSLRSQVGEASHVLTAALCGEERAGEQAHLPALARMMVDALTLEAANAEQARMQLDSGDDVDAATRRYLGEALSIADPDDTPPSLSDFYDAVVEAREERDEARKERDAAIAEVARLRGSVEGRELVWVTSRLGSWVLAEPGQSWLAGPYIAYHYGVAEAAAVNGAARDRDATCDDLPAACRQIAAWARADGHIVPPHPLGWDVGVSDG